MREIVLKPIIHHDEYSALLEAPINAYFSEAIFEPLLEVVREARVKLNEHSKISPVETALRDSVIFYAATTGTFSGRFTAPVSRELRSYGATYSNGLFKLSAERVPSAIKVATVASEAASAELHQRLISLIDQMAANLPSAKTGIGFESPVTQLTAGLDKQLRSTLGNVPTVRVPSPIRADAIKTIARDLETNNEAPTRDFAQKQLRILREKIVQNLAEGGRTDRLAKLIETRAGIARRYAAARAEHETAILIANYREQRYRSMGIESYIWETRHDERVREGHRLLDATTQLWDAPPVENPHTGERGHPGWAANCRCVARGVLKLRVEQVA